ncbi:MAG: hypothetical protein KatS3mg076_2627 [Candidatus Binatia bacterium]|nr:MAG: hypothetical protein KatS3mg076_2627 [Candidatus Binatia bacterium]
MANPVVSVPHEVLARRGYLSVKFNFPYKERGGTRPDPEEVLRDAYRSVAGFVSERYRPEAVVLGGKSLGGRMASLLAAEGFPCRALVFLGYPLHPPRKTDRLRTAHLFRIEVPMLFFAGTRDSLCDLELLRRTLAQLRAPTTLHVVEGGDHSFSVPKRSGRTTEEVLAEIAEKTAEFLEQVLRRGEFGCRAGGDSGTRAR